MSPVRFLTWFLGVIFTLGLADSFGQLTYKMAKAAVHAHTHNQISYVKFNKFLWDQRITLLYEAQLKILQYIARFGRIR